MAQAVQPLLAPDFFSTVFDFIPYRILGNFVESGRFLSAHPVEIEGIKSNIQNFSRITKITVEFWYDIRAPPFSNPVFPKLDWR